MSPKRSLLWPVLAAGLGLVVAALACNAPSGVSNPPTPTPQEPPPVIATATQPEQVTPTSSGLPANPMGATKVESHIRSGPSTDHAVLGTLAAGLPIRLTGRNAERSWLQIEFSSSPSGRAWVSAENVNINPTVNVDALPIAGAPPPEASATPPGDSTPTLPHTPDSALSPTPSPAAITPSPRAGQPTATRRQPTATGRPSAPSPQPSSSVLRADNTRLGMGECTTLRWDVDNVKAVYLQVGSGGEQPVNGHDTLWICPDVTTIYSLHVINTDDSDQRHTLTVMTSGACTAPIISRFEASQTHIKPGEVVRISWDVVCAQAVYFKEGTGSGGRQAVAGHDYAEVQPSKTRQYRLIVVAKDGSEIKQDITITVEED